MTDVKENIYIHDLPETFEQFADARKNAFLSIKELKDKGIPLVGAYCTYFPEELAWAAGASSVGLCQTSDETIEEAEKVLPKNLCPMIKASYGFAATDKCPFFYFSDIIVGETTCDGKKKMYELMNENIKETYVLNLPNDQSDKSLRAWKQEILDFKDYIEQKLDSEITEESLRKSAKLGNDIRDALKDLANTMRLDPAPMDGYDFFKVSNGVMYNPNKEEIPAQVRAITQQVLDEYDPEKRERKPRIIITGCPIGGAPEKVIKAIEAAGGQIVGFENCNGEKRFDNNIDLEAEDIYEALARRYLDIGCSVMTPDENRFELLGRMIDEYKADGVVEMDLVACHTYNVEREQIKNFCQEEKGIPYTYVETDFSQADVGQINTRMAAFVEML